MGLTLHCFFCWVPFYVPPGREKGGEGREEAISSPFYLLQIRGQSALLGCEIQV